MPASTQLPRLYRRKLLLTRPPDRIVDKPNPHHQTRTIVCKRKPGSHLTEMGGAPRVGVLLVGISAGVGAFKTDPRISAKAPHY